MAIQLFEIFVLGRPRGKGRHRTTKGGRAYPDPKTVNFEVNLMETISKVWKNAPLDCAVGLRIIAYTLRPQSLKKSVFVPRSKPDFDNYEKAVADALNGVVWRDDALIADSGCKKRFCTPEIPQEGLMIRVFTLTEADL